MGELTTKQSGQFEFQTHQVWTRESWSGPWIARPHLICGPITLSAAPQIPSAELFWKSGSIIQPGTSPFADYDLLDINKHFVKIQINVGESIAPIVWFGFILRDSQERFGAKMKSENVRLQVGNQRISAVGLEWFLDQIQPSESFVDDPDNTDPIKIERVLGFNSEVDFRNPETESPANKSPTLDGDGVPQFVGSSQTPELWKSTEIVSYMLAHHGPQNPDGSPFAIAFTLDSNASTYLDWYTPSFRAEGQTSYQIINEVVNRRNMVGWRLDVVEVADVVTAKIVVFSLAPTPIVLPGGGTIQPNAQQDSIDFDDAYNVKQTMVRRDDSTSYDQIIVTGAAKTATFTLGAEIGNLAEDWTFTQEQAYNDGAKDDTGYAALTAEEKLTANDQVRSSDALRNVFTTFALPTDWDGKSNDGSISTPQEPVLENACPPNYRNLRFSTRLPLLSGYDYSTDASNPTNNNAAGTKAEPVPPFAAFEISNKWQFAHSVDPPNSSFDLQILSSKPAFRLGIKDGNAISLALNKYDAVSDSPSATSPLIDTDWLIATVSVEWDDKLLVKYPETVVLTERPVRKLVIDYGSEARFDWLAKQTVVDIRAGERQINTAGGAIRDDTDLLKKIAKVYYAWYSIQRAELDMSLAGISPDFKPGNMISKISGDNTEQYINTTITSVSYDLAGGVTQFKTQFSGLDLRGLS